jgi:hypothetical protein
MKARQFLGIASAFIVGALASSVGGLWHPYVTVDVKNMSPKAVSEMEVIFQNTEGKGVLTPYIDQPLKTGEEMKFHFYVESEGAFALKAKFDDSQTVEGIGGYIELGNTRSVEIHHDGIKVARSK